MTTLKKMTVKALSEELELLKEEVKEISILKEKDVELEEEVKELKKKSS